MRAPAAVLRGAVVGALVGVVVAAVVVMPSSASGLGMATTSSPEPVNTRSSTWSWRTAAQAPVRPGSSETSVTPTKAEAPATLAERRRRGGQAARSAVGGGQGAQQRPGETAHEQAP